MSAPEKTSSPHIGVPPTSVASVAASGWTWAALLVALLGLAGSLYLSLGMNLKACPLCFYQRAFVMSVFGVLGIGLVTGARRSGWLSLVVLAPATAGLGVALFHVYLEAVGKLECPQGLLGWGTAPKQSLGTYALLFVILLVDVFRAVKAGAVHWGGLAGAVVLGGLLAAASCTSNPPMPAPPKGPYATQPPDICRPPYVP